MIQGIEAAAAVVPLAWHQRRYDRENLCFKIQFRVLKDDEVMQALYQLQPSQAPQNSNSSAPLGSQEIYTQNFSAGGLGLGGDLRALGDEFLEEGDFLKIEIHLPHSLSKIRCLGSVAWVEVDYDAEIFRAGVSFVAVNPLDL